MQDDKLQLIKKLKMLQEQYEIDLEKEIAIIEKMLPSSTLSESIEPNKLSFRKIKENLIELGIGFRICPLIICFGDILNVLSIEFHIEGIELQDYNTVLIFFDRDNHKLVATKFTNNYSGVKPLEINEGRKYQIGDNDIIDYIIYISSKIKNIN